MTDRELLEAAAKAAGYWSHEFNCPDKLPAGWNPLAYDGDALRLAVALEIVVTPLGCVVQAFKDGGTVATEDKRTDPAAATRRAIVRAAAAMSRAPGAE